jgi:hypothetical protein
MSPEEDAALTYVLFRRKQQLTQPSGLWYLIDEDEATINDAMFVVDMDQQNSIPDRPSTRHGPSYVLVFADGHSENIRMLQPDAPWMNGGTNLDWLKLKELTTVKKSN